MDVHVDNICWSSRRELMDFKPDGLGFLSDIGGKII